MSISANRLRNALLTIFVISTGCVLAMPNDDKQGLMPPPLTKEVQLHFKRHNFEAICYDTIGCTVTYNGRYQVQSGPGEVSSPRPSGDYRKTWGSVELGIRNFPEPAEVHWKSKDGTTHDAKVDIGQIFRDELIWHNVPKDQMADFYSGPVAGAPDIYLEVNDRTINVYTAMFIPTRSEQIPGNKDSDFRKDIFLVWSKTY